MNDAHQEGYDAFKRGLPQDDNPYPADADKKRRWEEGWEDAKIDTDLNRRSICSEREADPA